MDFVSNSFLSKSTILNFMNVLLLLFSMDLKYVITASVCVCVCVCVLDVYGLTMMMLLG